MVNKTIYKINGRYLLWMFNALLSFRKFIFFNFMPNKNPANDMNYNIIICIIEYWEADDNTYERDK